MLLTIIIFGSALTTATLSGIFGMGGGMILIGVFAATLPLTTAMLLHGGTQLGANGYRAVLLARHVCWRMVAHIGIGALAAIATLVSLQLSLEVNRVFIILGTIPIAALLFPKSIGLSIERPSHAIGCGYAFVALQLLAGASGPILDAFFLRTRLSRFEIVATKSAISCIGHSLKLLYWGVLLSSAEEFGLGQWIFVVSIGAAFMGTRLGKRILTRLSESQFRHYSTGLVIAIATIYLIRGVIW